MTAPAKLSVARAPKLGGKQYAHEFVAPEAAETALAALRPLAPSAALIGECRTGAPQVVLDTGFGGQRALDELEDDPLPRIC